MHIAIVGPIAGDDVREFLAPSNRQVPVGYPGAPLTGILIGELLRLGHRVTGITTDQTLPLAQGPVRCEGAHFSLVVCPARSRALRPNGFRLGRAIDLFALERRFIREAIAAAAPEIVHAHWSYEFALSALAQPIPHLITCHDSPAVVLRYTRSPYRALRYLMAQWVFKRGREFSTVSDYMAHELSSSMGHLPEVIPNPVAPYVLSLGRVRTAPSLRRVAMVCNGWDRRKNPEPALRAFACWRSVEPSAELHLFGADFGAGEVAQAWANAEGVAAGLNFHGRIPHRQLIAALNEMDALLHPALEESFGVVLAEAMALGLPVVAGKQSGAVPWVLGDGQRDHETLAGVLTDVTSPSSIAEALQVLFDKQYEEFSRAGRQRAAAIYSPQAVTRAYLNRYESVLSVLRRRPEAIATKETP